jgi:vacuolar-type H+-ATPase subunit E/Vma4
MLNRIKEAVENMRANVDARLHVASALEEIGNVVAELKERVEGIAHEATGETGAAVTDLQSRLVSLTSAVSSLGSTVGALGSRLDAIEQKEQAPAAPVLHAPFDPAAASTTPPQA